MFQSRRLPFLAPFLLFLLGGVHAMFEDEAGKLDWQIENVGRVTLAAFDAGKLFVGTGAAVVASLDAATGRVDWRRVLQPEDSIDAVLALRHYALSVSGGGRLARLWSAADGTLMWDAMLPAPAGDGVAAAPPSSVAAVAATTGAELYVSSNGTLHVLHSGTGALLRSYSPSPAEDKDLAALVGSDATVHVTDVRPRPGGGVFAAGIALRKGRAESLLEFELAGATAAVVVKAGRAARSGLEVDQGAVLLAKPGGGYVVTALAVGGKSVAVFDSAGGGAVVELEVSAHLGGNAAAVLRALQTSGGVLLELAVADGAAASAALSLAAASGGSWQLLAVAVCSPSDGKECLLAAHSIGDRVTVASVSRSSDGSVSVASRDGSRAAGSAWSDAVSVSLPLDATDHGAMRSAFLAPAASAGGSPGLLAVSADDSVALLQGGKQAWVREEALAAVESVDFVDLAADELTVLARQGGEGGSAGAEHHLPGLQERLRLQWLEVRAMGARLLSAVTGQPLPPDLAALATRDPAEAFGFRKLAVCATSVGRLIALHMDGGAVSWARPLPLLPTGSGAAAAGPAKIFATRPNAVLGYLPEFVVVRPGGGDAGSDGLLTQHDGLTGAETGPATVVKGGLRSVVPLDAYDAEDRRILMLVDNANRVSVWPQSSEARAAFAKLLPTSPIFHHHLSSTGLISYTVVAGASGDETSFASQEVASMALPPDQVVVGVAYRDRRDVIQSPAQALGDESLLLKYLNPHIVAVLTMGPVLPGIEGRELTLLLVDTVSARVLQRVAHQGAAGPVHAVVVENRVAYTYWNARARRTELGSVSLFEGVIDRHGLSPLNIPEYKETFSAFEAHAPVTVHRTYVFPHAVLALGATVTGQGIAAKNLLVGYGAGQLLSLEAMWIDARRPLGEPNKAEKLEKLPQYQPFLPVIRQQTVSHLRVIERLHDVYAAPASLESTSLVLAVGLDVFGARVAPSKAFDLLSSEFNYAMLMVVLASMAAFNAIASVVVRRKELAARWA